MAGRRLTWYAGAPVVLGLAGGLALTINVLLSDYFIRTFVDEPDPFAGAPTTPAAEPTATATTPAATSTPTGTAATPATTATPTATPTPEAPPMTVTPALVAEGAFRDGEPGHHGSGTARIGTTTDGSLVLRLEDFSVTGGPDLFVYLTPDPDGEDTGGGINLGELKGTDGNQNYTVPAGTDLAGYRAVVIWCRAFDVIFAVATLEVQQ